MISERPDAPSNRGTKPTVIGFLIRVRHVSLVLVLLLLVLLVAFGKRVSYEQSIRSFFAPDDPVVIAYAQAAKEFGDDNFVFVVYDDPALLTPAGMDRVSELAGRVASERVPGVLRVESLDAMPLLWKVDDALLALDRLPAFARTMAMNASKRSLKNLDLKSNALTVGGAIRSADPAALADLRRRVTAHPLFRGTLIDASGTSAAIVVRLKKTVEHTSPPRSPRCGTGRRFAERARDSPARRGRPAGPAGRRLQQHRARRPPAGGGGDAPDRPGDALGHAEPLVGARADPRRMGGLAGDRVGPGVADLRLSLSEARWSRRSSC
jgi:hypothetical protein